MTVKLRPYQEQAVKEIIKSTGNTILSSPTGSGKSVIIQKVVEYYIAKGKTVAVSVSATVLIKQLYMALKSEKYDVGIIKSGESFKPGCSVNLIMEQTYYARQEQLDIKCDILIRDEHHIGIFGERYNSLIEGLSPERVIGFTATPIDEVGYKLDKDAYIVETTSTKDLISMGFLSNVNVVIPKQSELINYSKVGMSVNDYNSSKLDTILNTPKHNKFIANMVKQYMVDRKSAIFANSIEHVEALSTVFTEEGIPNVILHSKLPERVAKTNLQLYKSGEVKTIINMSILTTGFDDPETNGIVLVRPTKILRLYLQIVGRGLRTIEGKQDCRLLDLAQCVRNHGMPDRLQNFNITDETVLKEEKDDAYMDDIQGFVEENGEENITAEKILEYKIHTRDKRIDELLLKLELAETEASLLQTDVYLLKGENAALQKKIVEKPSVVNSTTSTDNIESLLEQYSEADYFDDKLNIANIALQHSDSPSETNPLEDWQIDSLIRDFYKVERESPLTSEELNMRCINRLETILDRGLKLSSLHYYMVEGNYLDY